MGAEVIKLFEAEDHMNQVQAALERAAAAIAEIEAIPTDMLAHYCIRASVPERGDRVIGISEVLKEAKLRLTGVQVRVQNWQAAKSRFNDTFHG